MTWQAVARKDFDDASRSRWLWVLSALFAVLIGGSAYIFATSTQDASGLSTDQFLPLFGQVAALMIPLVAIVVAYNSVIGERDSGTMKLLLALPHSRMDVVVGKTIGRGAVVALPVLGGFALGAVVFLATGVTFAFGNYLAFALLTVLLGAIFVAIAVGFSAGAATSRRAVVGAVGTYFMFSLFWSFVRRGAISLANEGAKRIPGLEEPAAETLVTVSLAAKYLNPVRAYETLAASLYAQDQVAARLYGTSNPFLRQMARDAIGGDVPAYLTDPVIGVILIVWLVVPLALGYLAFQEMDLT
ncbi:MAG: ABC transporter permease [Halobacteriales archaeon]|nr:ABC transporter permease [Halobacteriales archaeon]